MSERGQNRSGLQTAADLARLANAVRKIIKAALQFGIKGAIVATVKEAAPFLVKVVIGVLIFLIVTPMLVFAAIPNIFFGYESSNTDAIKDMNDRAAALGGVYMNLSYFERAEIDAIVTSIVSEYEEQGIEIDNIEVTSSFTEETLMWIISINSVAFQQDLNVMTSENIRELCKTTLKYNIKILEVLPVNIYLKSANDRQTIIEAYASYLKIAPNSMEIEVRTLPADTSDYVDRMKGYAETEDNESCRAMIEDNIKEIGEGIASEAIRHRFFIIFEYEPQMKAKRNTVRGIVDRLNEEADTARRYLDLCELEVLEPRYTDNFMLQLLYEIINKKASRRVKLPEGVFDMTTAVHGIYEQ